MNKHLVIGLGEVGSAIKDIFKADGYDWLTGSIENYGTEYKFLHICFPYTPDFIDHVERYQKLFDCAYTIVHSTVPVGTCSRLAAIHSPVRGLHPNLYKGIMTFEKFIGGQSASIVADEFRRHGLRVILCNKSETTELGKLLDTEYYRACIDFTKRAKNLADKSGVPFHEAYTLFNQTYNSSYTKLGYPEYVRPVLQPIEGEIGGHCVMQNSKLL